MLGAVSLRFGLVAIAFLLAACGGDDDDAAGSTSTSPTSATPATTSAGSAEASERCIVRLHGKGGTGADTVVEGGVAVIAPTGNADGWGARQWLYFPDEEYEAATAIVAEAAGACDQVIVHGFSNGAAFAAKLYCRGETLDGRLVGVVVDDPVVDAAVEGCAPDPSVDVALYWTGALEGTAQPGWDCTEGDWTCEGGVTIGVDAYAAALGATTQESPFDEHQWHFEAPELNDWWR